MNKIIAIGDLHGDPFSKLGFRRNHQMRKYDENDVVVFLGDWGIVFGHWNIEEEANQLEWLNNQKYKSIVIFGNHDDYDWAECLPEVEAFGTTMKQAVLLDRVYENVFIVDNWCIADICGKKCLLIAHADSHDLEDDPMTQSGLNILTFPQEKWLAKIYNRKYIFYRVMHQSWWPQEHLNIKDFQVFRDKENLDNQKFDYIFSHDCPESYHYVISPTPQESLFEELRLKIRHKMWLHGHMHTDTIYNDGKTRCVMDDTVEL